MVVNRQYPFVLHSQPRNLRYSHSHGEKVVLGGATKERERHTDGKTQLRKEKERSRINDTWYHGTRSHLCRRG